MWSFSFFSFFFKTKYQSYRFEKSPCHIAAAWVFCLVLSIWPGMSSSRLKLSPPCLVSAATKSILKPCTEIRWGTLKSQSLSTNSWSCTYLTCDGTENLEESIVTSNKWADSVYLCLNPLFQTLQRAFCATVCLTLPSVPSSFNSLSCSRFLSGVDEVKLIKTESITGKTPHQSVK